jgi:phosphoenolpyruvate-protein phosphotransferase (PTS system enzyme I)
LHPGVIRLLRHIISTSTEHGIPVSVCGEIAGDPALAPLLLALGLTEFSLHPATLLELRRVIRNSDLSVLRSRASKLLQARDRAGIERWLKAVASQ